VAFLAETDLSVPSAPMDAVVAAVASRDPFGGAAGLKGASFPFYQYRHIVQPGMTGWTQVSQGHVAGLEHVLGKLHDEVCCIKNFSIWLDIMIVLKTVRTIFKGFGAR
jgi:hypothetical protein